MASAIQIQPVQVAPATSSGIGFGGSLFFVVVVFLIVLIFVMLIGGIILYFVLKYFREKKELLLNVRRSRLRLAKVHGTLPAKFRFFIWKIKKNPPIRVLDNKGHISKPICYYAGHYWSEEGNLVMAIYLRSSHFFWIIPKKQVLLINNLSTRKIQLQGRDDKLETVTIRNLPTAKDLVQINNDPPEIFIKQCLGVDVDSSIGMFYLPTFVDKEDKVIDLSPLLLEDARKITTVQMYFDQLQLQAEANKKAVKGNPDIKMQQQKNNQSQNIENP